MPRKKRENIIKKIKRLWNDPKFGGAFQGANSFRDHLYFEKNVDAKLSTIYKALSGDEIYLMHKKSLKVPSIRHYRISASHELMEMDLGEFDLVGQKI